MAYEIPQVTISPFPPIGINGQFADTGFKDVTTGICDVAVDPGLFLVLGANGYQSVKLPAVTGDIASGKGFSVFKTMTEARPGLPLYPATSAIDVLRVGRIYIVVQGTVIDEGPVFIIHAGASAGMVRGDASSGGTAATVLPRAKCIKGASAGNVAIISINLP